MMVTFEALKNKEEKVCVVGLGYVGLPLAVLLAKHFDVIGFDIDEKKIGELREGHDRMREVSDSDLAASSLFYTTIPDDISKCKYIIVAVPTPVDENRVPNLKILEKASEMVGKHMVEGSIVVFESTVYPGATEEVCVPVIEKESGLKSGEGFWVGYSPERVNPGDKERTIDKITKVTAGMDEASADVIDKFYGTITTTHKAPTIKVAEAAKVIENTQRDINIALMNELSVIFDKVGIRTADVLEAAGTKWNFLKFHPGLVGGHCIGVDPYYLTHKAQELGYEPKIILAGRGLNDSMHDYISSKIFDHLAKENKEAKDLNTVVAGITFKENVPDVRNSKVADLVKSLQNGGLNVSVFDPIANAAEVEHEYGIKLTTQEEIKKADVFVLAVKHDKIVEELKSNIMNFVNEGGLVVDIKSILDPESVKAKGLSYWSL